MMSLEEMELTGTAVDQLQRIAGALERIAAVMESQQGAQDAEIRARYEQVKALEANASQTFGIYDRAGTKRKLDPHEIETLRTAEQDAQRFYDERIALEIAYPWLVEAELAAIDPNPAGRVFYGS